MTISGAVSPIARDSARITPVAMPAIDAGRTCRQIVCHCVAPSASEPSRIDGGTARIASRDGDDHDRQDEEPQRQPAGEHDAARATSGPRTMNARPRIP